MLHVRLSDLQLEPVYRTGDSDVVRELYEPCLLCCSRYYRAVGFFSTSSVGLLASSLKSFHERGGRIRLLMSPHVSKWDDHLLRTMANCSRIGAVPAAIDDVFGSLWLARRLDLRIATPTTAGARGMYHEKLGLFIDDHGDFVAYVGSLNETATAFRRNYEHVEVFCSWRPGDQLRALEKISYFEALWNGRVPGLVVHRFPEAARLLVPSFPGDPDRWSDPGANENDMTESNGPGDKPTEGSNRPPTDQVLLMPEVPARFSLRKHQTAAIARWFEADLRGILKMATGSGKTLTALTAATLLTRRSTRLLIVVVCPFTHLVDQWAHQAEEFGFQPIKCYGSRRVWHRPLVRSIGHLNRRSAPFAFAVTTHATFSLAPFQTAIAPRSAKTLLIGDEVHGMGSLEQLRVLTSGRCDFDYRLGLSATPERFYDDQGTDRLTQYFGPIVYEYSLRDALEAGVLVPYDYYPELIELTDAERVRYSALTRRIARAMSQSSPENDKVTALLSLRARLLASAAHKLPHLQRLLAQQAREEQRVSHTLIYCGDGRVETDSSGDRAEHRYVEAVSDLLAYDLQIPCSLYVAETRLEHRLQLQQQLASGKIGAIVAIRCLDEGVDIPPVRFAYILASSRNPRQFIQRRGRVLRTDPASGKRSARIYDFVVVPPLPVDEETWQAERRLFRNELRRVLQFSSMARNEGLTLRRLRELREAYQLLTLSAQEDFHDLGG